MDPATSEEVNGAAAIGGTMYGGIIVATIGVFYGPRISLYMKF